MRPPKGVPKKRASEEDLNDRNVKVLRSKSVSTASSDEIRKKKKELEEAEEEKSSRKNKTTSPIPDSDEEFMEETTPTAEPDPRHALRMKLTKERNVKEKIGQRKIEQAEARGDKSSQEVVEEVVDGETYEDADDEEEDAASEAGEEEEDAPADVDRADKGKKESGKKAFSTLREEEVEEDEPEEEEEIDPFPESKELKQENALLRAKPKDDDVCWIGSSEKVLRPWVKIAVDIGKDWQVQAISLPATKGGPPMDAVCILRVNKKGKQHFRHVVPARLLDDHIKALTTIIERTKKITPFNMSDILKAERNGKVYDCKEGLTHVVPHIPLDYCQTRFVSETLYEIRVQPITFPVKGVMQQYDALVFSRIDPNRVNEDNPNEPVRYSVSPSVKYLYAFHAAFCFIKDKQRHA